VQLGTAVRTIHDDTGSWQVEAGTWQRFDALVIAIHPAQAVDLLDGITDTAGLAALTYEPISTCYLQYDSTLRLSAPFFALQDDASCRRWGQFVFDRGWLDPRQAGLLAVVVSASSAAIEAGNAALTGEITAQLAHELQMPALATPRWSRLITEKRATFSCSPQLQRPTNETACKGLVLAGDYTASDYPATLESAVRSGLQAAQLLL
jgi:predicted NAD/FAD-binding protein